MHWAWGYDRYSTRQFYILQIYFVELLENERHCDLITFDLVTELFQRLKMITTRKTCGTRDPKIFKNANHGLARLEPYVLEA